MTRIPIQLTEGCIIDVDSEHSVRKTPRVVDHVYDIDAQLIRLCHQMDIGVYYVDPEGALRAR